MSPDHEQYARDVGIVMRLLHPQVHDADFIPVRSPVSIFAGRRRFSRFGKLLIGLNGLLVALLIGMILLHTLGFISPTVRCCCVWHSWIC